MMPSKDLFRFFPRSATRSITRSALKATLALFVITLGGVACTSDVKKVDLAGSTSPTEEMNRLDQDMNAGYAEHYDILAYKDFEKAEDYQQKAKKQMARNDKPERVLESLGYARAHLNRAKERSETMHDRAKGILEARSLALKAGVRNNPRLRESLKFADDDMRAEIKNLDEGSTTTQRWSNLQSKYLDLELGAIQDTNLASAKAKIHDAIKNGARKNTPNMLTQAERDFRNAENIIAANRHDQAAIAPAVQRSNESAALLTDVLAATKRPEGVINEDAARAMVMQNRTIKTLDQKLGATATQASEQSRELARQREKLSEVDATLQLNKALESARKEFNSDEAEVYRQGDKLVIRLKAINFPSGKADLPPQSMDLLGKVKTVAEELNPQQVVIEGHTDSTGSAAINRDLSQSRAEAVANYLASSSRVDRDKVEAIGRGFEKPIVSNKTKTGRAQNRRVDVIITPGAVTNSDAPASGSSNTQM
jgi:OmpA-OmpF porin, OOP family